ncbi:Gldg family protein [Sphingopyxis panaciterrae]
MTRFLRRPVLRALAIDALVLVLAWIAGGQYLLDRIDPALGLPLLAPPMLLLGWWQRRETARVRRTTILIALALLLLAQGLLAALLVRTPGWAQLALMLTTGAVAAFASDALVQWRRGRAVRLVAALAFALGWFAAGHALLSFLYRPVTASVDAPAVTMLTGLPLRWTGGGDIAAMITEGTADDPALARLEAMGPVSLVDSIVDHVPPRGGALLLAHPRALAPQELVAIDAFVRGGGRAVVLADALSGWPARHPLGDPRNPPVTSLLTPLLDHWGVTLGAAPVGGTRARAADIEGARLRLFSAGRFDRLPTDCRVYADRRVAACSVGAGEVWLVGDADLLFAPLWQPLVNGASHLRRADTMDWLAARLWGDTAGHAAALQPLWIGSRS